MSVTKAMVERAARSRYGKGATVRHYPNRPDAARRAELNERRRVLAEEVRSLTAEIDGLRDADARLREAARFAVDIDCEEPARSRMAEALLRAERLAEARKERKRADEAMRNVSTHSRRWAVEVVNDVAGFKVCHVYQQADTLEDLYEQVCNRTRKATV